ncbi:BURP domain-containing protein 5-like [Abrus precatorius]|uniref:BURP domain-containing protein 5-like n=1 Tax=Abrus precatorius TaxID=3816 RepID=A0A8B8K2Z0_ABRPR|nr:BURP domain-containing protein 5-like [Abrus precatorius]
MADPGREHWNVVKRILRYIKGTSNVALCFEGSEFIVKGYVDSDFAGDLDKRKSTTGYVFTLAGGAVSWLSKLHTVVALSTTEVEYMAATEACKEAIWIQRLLEELGHKQVLTTHAALPPQLYWERMLPNSPMPKAVIEFLKHGLPVADHHRLDDVKVDLIFLEEGLRPGTKINAHFYKIDFTKPLLPLQVAQHIPFSSKKMKEILEILSMKPKSEIAKVVEREIRICEVPPPIIEEKLCATSLESMVDFVTSKLGKNVRAFSTYAEREAKSQNFLVKDGVKKIADESVIACHLMDYPYAVFLCHHLQNTTAHFMPLEGEDGTRVKAIAVCHKDTSLWDPDSLILQAIKIKPGDCLVCHIFPEVHVVFTKLMT